MSTRLFEEYLRWEKNNIRSYLDTVMELFALGLACFHKLRKHKNQQ